MFCSRETRNLLEKYTSTKRDGQSVCQETKPRTQKKALDQPKARSTEHLEKQTNPKALHFLHILSVVDLFYYLIVGNLIHKFLYYPKKLLAEAADTLFEFFKEITAEYVDI